MTGRNRARGAMLLAVQALMGGTMLAAPALGQAQATAQASRFAIPKGPLGEALARFSQQSGLQLAYDADLTRGLTTNGVDGTMAPIAALSRLLQGTGLSYRVEGRRVTLERAPQSADATMLGPVRVGASNERGGAGGANPAGTGGRGEGSAPADRPYLEAGSSAYIPQETIERFRGATVADVVKGVAGVTAGDPRVANALDVNIRGVQGQGRVPILIDGAQSGMDTYRGYAGQSQRAYLDPDLISAITIEKGPSLATNASGGIGGVVSVDTLKPGDVLRDGQNIGARVRVGLSDGSAPDLPGYSDKQRRRETLKPGGFFGNAALAWRNDDIELLAAYAHRETGNYYAGSAGYADYPLTRRTVAALNPRKSEVFNTSAKSDSILLKGTWRIDDSQAIEASYRRYEGRQGEIMASQIIRGTGEQVPQWEPGRIGLDAYTLTYRAKQGAAIDFTARAWYTHSNSLMYNGLTGITPWFYDRRTEWWDAPTFNSEAGYRDAYWNELTNNRWGYDLTNISKLSGGLGDFTFTYGLAFANDDIKPGPNSPIKHDDIVNNRFLRNAHRQEYSGTASVKWQPDSRWEVLVGGRLNHVEIQDRNRLATVTQESQIGMYRYTELLRPNPSATNPNRTARVQLLNWYPDANGQFTYASLLASPFEKGTVADIPGWTTYKADPAEPLIVPTAWSWSRPIKRRDTAFTPTGTISYDAGFARIYGRYAEGVKLPSIFETTLGLFTAARPVAELKPERSRSWEIGASTLQRGVFARGDRLAVKVAYFNTNISDLITRDYRTLSAGLIRNVDKFKVSGVEFQSEYSGRVPFVNLSAHYYLKAKTCAPDIAAERRAYGKARGIDELINTPDCVDGGFEGSYTNTQNPPRFNLNATLGARLFDDRLTFGARLVHNSGPISRLDKEWNVGLSAIQQLYKRSSIVDAFLSAKVTEQVQLDLNVDNLTDRYYLDPLALGVMPAPGRTFRAALSFRY